MAVKLYISQSKKDEIPVTLTKKRTEARARGFRGDRDKSQKQVRKAVELANKLQEDGALREARSDEEQFAQFMMLENIGTPPDVIRQVLNIDTARFKVLRNRVRAWQVAELSEDGVVGTVSKAFHRIELAARKILMAIESGGDDPKLVAMLTRELVDFESRKVDLLVRTGAIKLKPKIELHHVLEERAPAGDESLVSGAQAAEILKMLVQSGNGVIDSDTVDVIERTSPARSRSAD